jgi:hypothetical protein
MVGLLTESRIYDDKEVYRRKDWMEEGIRSAGGLDKITKDKESGDDHGRMVKVSDIQIDYDNPKESVFEETILSFDENNFTISVEKYGLTRDAKSRLRRSEPSVKPANRLDYRVEDFGRHDYSVLGFKKPKDEYTVTSGVSVFQPSDNHQLWAHYDWVGTKDKDGRILSVVKAREDQEKVIGMIDGIVAMAEKSLNTAEAA